MSVKTIGIRCHECNKMSSTNIQCYSRYSYHKECKSCTSRKSDGYNYDITHEICYKCAIYCNRCNTYHCNTCNQHIHNGNVFYCKLCMQNVYFTDNCSNCGKKICNECTKKEIYGNNCSICKKGYYQFIYYNKDYMCLPCYKLKKSCCDICNLYKCECSINWEQIEYTEYNVTQLLKICSDCININNILVKTRYLLVIIPQTAHYINKKSAFLYDDHYASQIIKILLLIANTKHLYISKQCIIHILIPYIISNLLNNIKKSKTLKKMSKCIKCFNFSKNVNNNIETNILYYHDFARCEFCIR
jgi:hypothetical protein